MVINVGALKSGDEQTVLEDIKAVEKEFHVDFKGYNAVEVDQFLDLVLEDYQNFENTINEQKTGLARSFSISTVAELTKPGVQ